MSSDKTSDGKTSDVKEGDKPKSTTTPSKTETEKDTKNVDSQVKVESEAKTNDKDNKSKESEAPIKEKNDATTTNKSKDTEGKTKIAGPEGKPLLAEGDKNTAKIVESKAEKDTSDNKEQPKIEENASEQKSKEKSGVNPDADEETKPERENAKEAEEKLMPVDEGSSKFEGATGRLVFAVTAAAFGSAFQHGYNLGVINGANAFIEQMVNETTHNRTGRYPEKSEITLISAVIVSIYCVGGMIGGALTGFFSERYGRKGGLLINNVFAVIAAIFFGFCNMASSYEMIIVGRLVIGINNGLNAGLAPMYLSEIAPVNLRGAIGTVYQLVVTISILLSQIVALESLLGTETLWPVMLALTVLPAIFQLITLPICPESPKFLLINKEQRLAAQRALTWLRDSSNVLDELEEIQNEAEARKLVPSVSLREILMNPALRIPLGISVMMMLAQQFSGINAAIFFSVKIYESAQLSSAASLYATIGMGCMNVLMTVVSLVLVEKAGRKTLMLVGLSGMCIDTVILTIVLALAHHALWLKYTAIALLILFVVMFATGPGSIPWFLVNELFASNARPTASSIAVAVNWTAAFFVGLGFPLIQDAIGPYVFLVFSFLLVFFIIFTYFKVPETKGRSIDEITAVFKQQAYGGAPNKV